MVTNVEVHTSISTSNKIGALAHSIKYLGGKPHVASKDLSQRALGYYGYNVPNNPQQAYKIMTRTQNLSPHFSHNSVKVIREIKSFNGLNYLNPDDRKLGLKINYNLMKREHPYGCQILSVPQADGSGHKFHIHNIINPINPITLKSITHKETSVLRAIYLSRQYMNSLKPNSSHTFYVKHGNSIKPKYTGVLNHGIVTSKIKGFSNTDPPLKIYHSRFGNSWVDTLRKCLDKDLSTATSKDDYIRKVSSQGIKISRFRTCMNNAKNRRIPHFYKTMGKYPNKSKLITHGKHKGLYLHEKSHYTYSFYLNNHKYIIRDKKLGYLYNPNNDLQLFMRNKKSVHFRTNKIFSKTITIHGYSGLIHNPKYNYYASGITHEHKYIPIHIPTYTYKRPFIELPHLKVKPLIPYLNKFINLHDQEENRIYFKSLSNKKLNKYSKQEEQYQLAKDTYISVHKQDRAIKAEIMQNRINHNGPSL